MYSGERRVRRMGYPASRSDEPADLARRVHAADLEIAGDDGAVAEEPAQRSDCSSSTAPTRASRTACGAPSDDAVHDEEPLGRSRRRASGPTARPPRARPAAAATEQGGHPARRLGQPTRGRRRRAARERAHATSGRTEHDAVAARIEEDVLVPVGEHRVASLRQRGENPCHGRHCTARSASSRSSRRRDRRPGARALEDQVVIALALPRRSSSRRRCGPASRPAPARGSRAASGVADPLRSCWPALVALVPLARRPARDRPGAAGDGTSDVEPRPAGHAGLDRRSSTTILVGARQAAERPAVAARARPPRARGHEDGVRGASSAIFFMFAVRRVLDLRARPHDRARRVARAAEHRRGSRATRGS